jgi:hypothetical protein
MKNKFSHKLLFALAIMTIFSCRKDGIEIIDVSFTADKVTVNRNEEVTFTFGSGANALSIYTGDAGKDFEKSRIFLVEQKGYTETQLKTQVFAERVDSLKDYLLRIPNTEGVPSAFSYAGEMGTYQGKLVNWDYSNSTDGKYIRLKVNNGPQTLVIKPDNAVLPALLRWDANKLRALGSLNITPNNVFAPFCAFPDGFTQQSIAGISVRFGVQFVVDGKESVITYYTQPVRELLDNLGFDLAAPITAFLTANPTVRVGAGISEIRLIFNADNPTLTDDDGPLLDYVGNVYIQEVRVGSADNTVKSFHTGVTIPYVFEGKTQTYKYKYTTAGTYKATMVATYIGRKKYSGDGYQTSRADDILASEYPLERRVKTIEIKVN